MEVPSPLLDVFSLFSLSPQSETTIINEGRRRSTSPGAKEWGERPPPSLYEAQVRLLLLPLSQRPRHFSAEKEGRRGRALTMGVGIWSAYFGVSIYGCVAAS